MVTCVWSRIRSLVAAGALVSGSMVVTIALAPPVAAAIPPVTTPTVAMPSADALPTAQIDGVVWQQAIVGNTVYAGGSFGNARPAGAAPGTHQVVRKNLLSYNLTTGVLISTFAPNPNGQVRAVTASPDGSRVYVGGDFTTVNGIKKTRIAAFSASTGQLLTTFDANVNYTVRAIVATAGTVYVAGSFTSSRGTTRNRLAAFSASTGALLAWNPNVDGTVNAMVLTANGSRLIIGGAFQHVGGAAAYGLAAVSPASGSRMSWNAGNTVRDAGSQAAILSLSTDAGYVYGSGYVYGTGGNLEGTFKADQVTGNIAWIEDCHGDTYDTSVAGGVVYTVGHAHYCGNIGGFNESNPKSINMRHALAFTSATVGTVAHNGTGNYHDWYGSGAPSLFNWFPDLTIGSFTGQAQAAWDVTANAGYVVMGGEFPSVNGVAQQGLVRFVKRSSSPRHQGPRLSGSRFVPTAAGAGAGAIKLSFTTNNDRDDLALTYRVIRDGNTAAPVYTTTSASMFWKTNTLTFTDKGLVPGSAHTYRLQAIDSNGNTVNGNVVSATAPSGASPASKAPKAAADATGTVSRSVVVGAPATGALESFSLTADGGWGSADRGGAWTSTDAARHSVAGQSGSVLLSTAGSGSIASLDLSLLNTHGLVDLSLDKAATGGGVHSTLFVRQSTTSSYSFTVKMLAGGVVTGSIGRTVSGRATTLGTATIAGLSVGAADTLRVRFGAVGSGTTSLSLKVWKVGSAEPGADTLSATDHTANLQAPGHFQLQEYLSGTATNAPVKVRVDNLSLT
jgi:hypothetical protein